jgi:hypothetical protein
MRAMGMETPRRFDPEKNVYHGVYGNDQKPPPPFD